MPKPPTLPPAGRQAHTKLLAGAGSQGGGAEGSQGLVQQAQPLGQLLAGARPLLRTEGGLGVRIYGFGFRVKREDIFMGAWGGCQLTLKARQLLKAAKVLKQRQVPGQLPQHR